VPAPRQLRGELEGGDKAGFVGITIEPLHEDGNESLYLVVFGDLRAPPAHEEPPAKQRKGKARDANLEQLERELGSGRPRSMTHQNQLRRPERHRESGPDQGRSPGEDNRL
jgi:hypothetical protein